MRGLWRLFGGQVGDLLLVGSLVTAPPTWFGSIELLSALGVHGTVAAFLSGLYVWGRIAISGAVLLERAHRGTLTLGVSGLLPETPEGMPVTAAGLPMASDPTMASSFVLLTADADEYSD